MRKAPPRGRSDEKGSSARTLTHVLMRKAPPRGRDGSARTRSDTDAHMRKAPGVMQMPQTRQMQIDEDALETERTSGPHVNLTAYILLRGELRPTTPSKEFVAVCGLRNMVRLN